MGSKVGLGDVRGLLVDTDKRPVLRLLPELDEVSRGYAIAHLGGDGCSIEDIASQVWTLNAIDWIREQDEIQESLCQYLDDGGFSRVLHELALKIAEDFLVSHEKQGGQFLKTSWDLLELKRKWLDGEVSDEELRDARSAYWAAAKFVNLTAYWAAFWAAYEAADGAAYWVADMAAEMAAEMAAVQKGQVRLLVEMLEDSVGIERGVEEKSLESKVIEGGL